MNKLETLDQIRCSRANGQQCLVIHYQIMVGLNSSPPQYAKNGRKWYELEDGLGVDLMEDGTFKVTETGEILRKL